MLSPSGALCSFFWSIIKERWLGLLAMQLLCLGWSLDQTLWPLIFGDLTDRIASQGSLPFSIWDTLSRPIISSIVLWFVIEISFRGGGFIKALLLPKLEADVRSKMFSYVQGHSQRFFADRLAGSIADKIADMARGMHDIFQICITLLFPGLIATLISTFFFIQISPLFGALLCGWMVLHTGICIHYAKKCGAASQGHSEARNALFGVLTDSLSNHQTVKLFGRQQHEREYLYTYQEEERIKNSSNLFEMEKMKMVVSCFCFFGMTLPINGLALYSWQQGTIGAGEVIFIINTMWNISSMAWLITLELPRLFSTFGVCRQALHILEISHDVVDQPKAPPLLTARGGISFQHVSFSYHQKLLFQDLSIHIEPGQKVGLVGFSGAGKSSFVHLILRYYDVLSGAIYIDGQDISKVSQESLHSRIAMIPQDATLFHRTILDNIRYGRSDASDEEVVTAAKLAHCHDFIMELPEGYDTLVGDRAVKISGGQRQRIAIARAMLADAPILILDEATSALDSVTEKYIQEGLSYLMRDRTTIVIAHRLSTLVDMDRILVFSRGRIAEDGTHTQLLARSGHYANLWNMQVGGFLPDYDIGTHYA